MLVLKEVCAGYGGADVVRHVSMHIDGNVSIIGPNGCGKTTLLKAIANILPHKGEITLQGKSFATMKRREIAMHIAMLSQQPSVYFAYSVYDTVMMGRYLHIKGRISDAPTQEDKAVVMQSLEAVGLWAEKDRDITKLSGGQLQRVFLARALAQQPRIILLDEPTNHLDLKCQMDIIAHLKQWAKQGERAVVGVLHDINLAMQLSDRLIIMHEGEVCESGPADEVIASGVLDRVYGMDVAGYMRGALERWR